MAQREWKISPFDGWPRTVHELDGGLSVHVDALTPEGMKQADAIGTLVMFLLLGIGVLTMQTGRWCLIPFGSAFILPLLVSACLYRALRAQRQVKFTPTEFKVLGKRGWYSFDRTIEHSFVMLEHDKAQREREGEAMRARRDQSKGQFTTYKRYYSESFHIALNYYGQRHDIVTVIGEQDARAIAARFQACDRFMDNQAKMGDRGVLAPQDQWDTQSGGLPS